MTTRCVRLWILLTGLALLAPSTSAKAQILRLPFEITPWQGLQNDMATFKGQLYVQSESPQQIWKYTGGGLEALPGWGPMNLTPGLWAEHGDYLYFGGGGEIWRTDGDRAELFHTVQGSIESKAIVLDDAAYFLVNGESPSAASLFRIQGDSYESFESSSRTWARRKGTVLGDAIVFHAEEFGSPARHQKEVFRDGRLSPFTFTEAGLPDDVDFHVVGIGNDDLFLWVENPSGNPLLYRSNLDSAEALFELDPAWEGELTVHEIGEMFYLITGDLVRSWNTDSGLRDEMDPHSGFVEEWFPMASTEDPESGETSVWLSRLLRGNQTRFVRLGPDGLVTDPDADALGQRIAWQFSVQLSESRAGLCVQTGGTTACARDGAVSELPYRLPFVDGQLDVVDYNGRTYWVASDNLVSIAALEGPEYGDYDIEALNVQDKWYFLGTLGDKSLVGASSLSSSRAQVWMTDGSSVEVVNPDATSPSLRFSDGRTMVFASEIDEERVLWTYDGSSVGSAKDFFGFDVKPDELTNWYAFGDQTLFIYRGDLWTKSAEGAMQLDERVSGDVFVRGNRAYYTTSGASGQENFLTVYDGEAIETYPDVVPSALYESRTRLVGDILITAVDGSVWFFNDEKEVRKNVDFPVVNSVLSDDGWLYSTSWDGSLYRTDGDAIEEIRPPASSDLHDLRGHGGKVYGISRGQEGNRLNQIVEGEIKPVNGLVQRMRWLPPSQVGLFLTIDELPYQVHDNGLVKLADEEFYPLGHVGQHLLGLSTGPGVHVLQTQPNIVSHENEGSPEVGVPTIQTYPNPVVGTAHILLNAKEPEFHTVEIFDALGRSLRVVHRGPLVSGEHRFTMDTSELASGVYLIRATTSDQSATTSLVVSGGR